MNSDSFTIEQSKSLTTELSHLKELLFEPKRQIRNRYDHISSMMKKLEDMQDKMEAVVLSNQDVKMNANQYIHKYNYSQLVISKQNSRLQELGKRVLYLENDLKMKQIDLELIEDSGKFKDLFIEMVSRRHSETHVRLNKLAPNHPALIFFKKEDVENLDEFTNKVHIQFAKTSKRVVSNILHESQRDKYC